MKNYAIFLFLSFSLVMFSCTRDMFDEQGEERVLSGDHTTSMIKNQGNEYYSLNVIPDWVKDSLSSENYELLKKLSAKFKIKYYLLDKNERRDSNILARYRKINDLLSNGILDTVTTYPKRRPIRSTLNKVERLTSEEGGSGDIDKGYDYASTIRDVESFMHGTAYMVVKAYFTWQKNISTRDFKDITLRVDLVADGAISGSKRWVDGGSKADRQGDFIRYVIIGTAEVYSGLEGVGIVLSRDVEKIGTLDPF